MPEQTLAAGALLGAFGDLTYLMAIALLLLKVFCLVDCLFRRDDAFRAANKQKKPLWVVLLAVAVVWDFFLGSLLNILSIAGLIVAIIYLVDVRPALREVGNGRRGGGQMGPYGPW